MPRRSSRPAPASPQAPQAAPKRRASARLSASEAEVKRVKSNTDLGSQVKSTTKKSKYFEPESSDEEPTSETDESGSDYEGQDAESSDEPSEPEEESESEDTKSVKSGRAKGKQGRGKDQDAVEASLKGKELWREGVRTGLGPGKEVFIPKPKARDAGGVPYEDETLHPNTKLFLLDLKKNNDRQWLKGSEQADWVFSAAHDADYRAAKKDFETFVEALTPKIAQQDATIPELPVKDLVGASLLLSWHRQDADRG
ncbi:hypothetical protein N7532_002815 [Penicillium argentinense]|uniref:Uncharacterized protein n=1 Tax=Penicillium argentinense TaxID=1131581 RepID=A0A9W9G132_9EURO|nr:uncharacterized protein N7532_002815 [Penicillium argentinense]KAJ5110170.1 hypothetical protein N7532_002815 [Penicillium argentinense]